MPIFIGPECGPLGRNHVDGDWLADAEGQPRKSEGAKHEQLDLRPKDYRVLKSSLAHHHQPSNAPTSPCGCGLLVTANSADNGFFHGIAATGRRFFSAYSHPLLPPLPVPSSLAFPTHVRWPSRILTRPTQFSRLAASQSRAFSTTRPVCEYTNPMGAGWSRASAPLDADE